MSGAQGLTTRRAAIAGSMASVLAAALPERLLAEAPAGIRAAIDTLRTGDPITPYMYGALEEHIGGLINYSLWAEVLDDRKFFYAIDDQPVPGGARTGARGTGRKWNPLPGSKIAMDRSRPYVGDWTPVVTLAGQRAGFAQSGLGLRPVAQVGRIVIAGNPGAQVDVTLIWGSGPGERQSVRVPVTPAWTTVPLHFEIGAKTHDGRIEIAGSGTGSFRVGAVSLMPADNVEGFRPDTIKLLRDLRSGFWRVPGGNFVSSYDWRDTIGEPRRGAARVHDHRHRARSGCQARLYALARRPHRRGAAPARRAASPPAHSPLSGPSFDPIAPRSKPYRDVQ